MVLFSYSRIYRDQRLSARITRGIFVASYKSKLAGGESCFYQSFVFVHTTKTAVLYHNRCSFKVQGVCILNQFLRSFWCLLCREI